MTTYSLGGQEWEIDLSKKNAATFRETLQPYNIDRSRSVERQASSPAPAKTRTNRWWGSGGRGHLPQFRSRTESQGHKVSSSGQDRGGDHRLDEAHK
jgi:hypothetical protein